MERRIGVHGPREVETIDSIGVVQAMGFFAESQQFSTRSCVRCNGSLVNDWCYDLDNTGEHIASVLRCVQCGHRIDPVILQNQMRCHSNLRATSGCRWVLRSSGLDGRRRYCQTRELLHIGQGNRRHFASPMRREHERQSV
jgi:hypothetical protein